MNNKIPWKFWELLGGRKRQGYIAIPPGASCEDARQMEMIDLRMKLNNLELQNRLLRAERDKIPWRKAPRTIVEPGDNPTCFYVVNADTGQGLDTEGRRWVSRELATPIYSEAAAIVFANRCYVAEPSRNIFVEIHRAPRCVSVEEFR